MSTPGGLATPVALKLVRLDLDLAPDALVRLRDEARLLARLQHPNVVRVLDLVRVADPTGVLRVGLVTELVEGQDLAALSEDGIPPRALAEVLALVAEALDAAWNAVGGDGKPLQVVHRDVKPSNVAVGRHGEVRLIDFGIAMFDGDDREARTASAMLVGSLPYLAPERFLERTSRPAADIFGVGAVWFECTVKEAWFAPLAPRIIPAVAQDRDRYEAFRWERLQRVPPPIRDALAPMLAWNPDDRPATANVARILEEVAQELAGPGLKSWCRLRAWPDPPVNGTLAGRTLVEATLEVPTAPRRFPSPPLNIVRAALATVDSGGGGRVAPNPPSGTVFVPVAREATAVPPDGVGPAIDPLPSSEPGRRRAPLALGAAGCAVLFLIVGVIGAITSVVAAGAVALIH
jgi:serine/threonine-protein kinase